MAKINILNKQHPLYQEDLEYILGCPNIDEIKGKHILITGATGLIGLCLIDAIMAYNRIGANITIYAVGRSKQKAASRLGEYYSNNLFHFIEQDARQSFDEGIKPDVIIPLASNTHPLAYSQYPIETIEINVRGAENALLKALECGATLLYPSTVEVYGESYGNEAFVEDMTGRLNLSNARSCYTESKRISEALCQSYLSEKGVKVKIARLCRVFGPTMLSDDTKASSQFITKALNKEDIVLKSAGSQFFSYTYVADAVSALLHILLHGEIGVAYNIANEKCDVHLKEFAETCANLAGTRVVYDIPPEVERRGFSVATRALLDTKRLRGLGYTPKYAFKDAIERTIKILG